MGPHPAARSLSKQMRPGDAGAVSELCQRLISARLVHGALTQLPHQQTESAAVTTCPILRCAGQITEGRETSDVGARSWESSLVLKQQRAISMLFSPSERLPRWLSGKKKSACRFRRCRRHGFSPWVGKIPWRRKQQPTPVFLSGNLHGHRSLVGCSPWGSKESDVTE